MRMQSLGIFDPRDPAVVADPYPHYARWRETDPVHRAPTRSPIFPEQWFLFRHADVAAALRDPRLGRDWHRVTDRRSRPASVPESLRSLVEMVDSWMLFADPPLHGELRGAVADAFRPRSLESLEAWIAARAESLLMHRPPAGGTFDVLADFALPLTSHAIARVLGIPDSERESFLRATGPLEAVFGGSPAELPRAAAAAGELRELFERSIERDSEGFLARFRPLAGEARKRAIANCVLLYGAGFATTVHAISNGALALARHPDAEAALRADGSLMPGAVEEVLRFDPPIQQSARFTLESLEIGGIEIPRGVPLTLMLGSANRDPAAFSEPDRFDPRREPRAHVAFGGGIHSCLGAWLARLEVRIALAALLRRFPRLTLADEPLEWREAAARGLRRLPLVVP
jgi:unspecific monooxygenase